MRPLYYVIDVMNLKTAESGKIVIGCSYIWAKIINTICADMPEYFINAVYGADCVPIRCEAEKAFAENVCNLAWVKMDNLEG